MESWSSSINGQSRTLHVKGEVVLAQLHQYSIHIAAVYTVYVHDAVVSTAHTFTKVVLKVQNFGKIQALGYCTEAVIPVNFPYSFFSLIQINSSDKSLKLN